MASRIYDPSDGRRGRRQPRGLREQPDSAGPDQPDRHNSCSRSFPSPTSRRALGQNNYQKAQTREKTTDGFDTKVNYTLNQKDQMSYRVSFMRPVVFDPGLFGKYGGPANGGFAGTGTNTSVSTRRHVDPHLQRARPCSTCAAA